MNRKEIREIKKRFNPDMDNFGHIYGCYVNAAHEIIAYMDSPTMLMGNEEREMYMKTLKKTLSGALGKNLLNVEFSTAHRKSPKRAGLHSRHHPYPHCL